MSAILHALSAVHSSHPQPLHDLAENADDEEPLPVTSYICKWKQPRRRKDATQRVSDAEFQKHVYGHEKKNQLAPIREFDPRPEEYKGTANQGLDFLLQWLSFPFILELLILRLQSLQSLQSKE